MVFSCQRMTPTLATLVTTFPWTTLAMAQKARDQTQVNYGTKIYDHIFYRVQSVINTVLTSVQIYELSYECGYFFHYTNCIQALWTKAL